MIGYLELSFILECAAEATDHDNQKENQTPKSFTGFPTLLKLI
jgi:hypothetical protein